MACSERPILARIRRQNRLSLPPKQVQDVSLKLQPSGPQRRSRNSSQRGCRGRIGSADPIVMPITPLVGEWGEGLSPAVAGREWRGPRKRPGGGGGGGP